MCCCLVTKLCLPLCSPMNCSMPGFPVFTISWSCSNSCALRQWCYSTISSSSVAFFSICPHSFPASRFFPVSQLFSAGIGESIGASALVLPMKVLGWFKGLTCFDLLVFQGTLKNLIQHHISKAWILLCSALTSTHDYWKNHSFHLKLSFKLKLKF